MKWFVNASTVVYRTVGAAAEGEHVIADRVQEMGLAQPRRRVQEQRVVGLARELGDGQRGRVGEAIAVADDELLERSAGSMGPRPARPRAWRRHDREPARVRGWLGAGSPAATALPRHPAPCGGAGLDSRPKRLATQLRVASGASDEEYAGLEGLGLEPSEPDLVGRIPHRSPQLGADLAPRIDRLELRRQLQATPLRECSRGTIGEGGRACPGRRIYQRPEARTAAIRGP